jgi:hypothetical protein
MGKKAKDLTGQKFNKLMVIKKAASNRSNRLDWLCVCECGTEKVVSSDHLTRTKDPIKSCGCSRFRRGNGHAQWLGYEGISGNWWYNHVLRERKQRERIRVPVTITKEYAWDLYLKQDKKCALSGQPILIAGGHQYNTASIDRIDSSKGYEVGNIQWVHKHVNFMKRTYSQEYFIDLCKKVAAKNL